MRISDWSSDVCSSDLSSSLRPADSIPAVARPGGQGPRHKAGRWFELAGSSTEGRTQMRLLTAAAMALAAFAGSAQAQDFPTKPVTFVVPFSPGGPNDIVGRQLATQISELWGQPVLVENRPGAGVTVGPAHVPAQPSYGPTRTSAE